MKTIVVSAFRRTISIRMIAMAAVSLASALALIQCSKSNPTPAPTTTVSVSSVSLNPASIAPGGTSQGTVSLSAAASGGASVGLSSSNTAVATVPASASVAAGAQTATFTVTGVGAGTASITASFNGTQSATITVAGGPLALASISLSDSTVVGGNNVTGTVTLTGSAPTGGAVVTLSSTDPVTVPSSVTVAGGSASATFTVTTRAVGGAFNNVAINASFGGATRTANLTVTPVPGPAAPVARFTVSGPGGNNVCRLTPPNPPGNGNVFDCTFEGSTSTTGAPTTISKWDWTYSISGQKTASTTTPTLTSPSADCNLIPPPSGATSLQMTVRLKVTDNTGRISAEVVNNNVSVLPQKNCGYAF